MPSDPSPRPGFPRAALLIAAGGLAWLPVYALLAPRGTLIAGTERGGELPPEVDPREGRVEAEAADAGEPQPA